MFCITLPPFSKLIFITVCLDCFKLYLKIDKFGESLTPLLRLEMGARRYGFSLLVFNSLAHE